MHAAQKTRTLPLPRRMHNRTHPNDNRAHPAKLWASLLGADAPTTFDVAPDAFGDAAARGGVMKGKLTAARSVLQVGGFHDWWSCAVALG